MRRTFARRGLLAAAVALAASACYSAGDGSSPPDKNFYFPVGLTVSRGGNVLYVVNSDFDLQWNGGTVQSYDLHTIRKHAALAILNPADPALPLLDPAAQGSCPGDPPIFRSDGTRQPLGETCAPPVDSTIYVRDSAIVGAFATDMQLSSSGSRLFVPVRGDASLTWADIAKDDPTVAPPADPKAPYAPFAIDCGTRTDNRCAPDHHAGNNANEPGNTRHLTMPGEPFGMAQSEDGSAIVISHQTDTKTSLFSTGVAPDGSVSGPPSLQFVVDGMALGGNGVVSIPHDPQAFAAGVTPPRPAFLQTSRAVAELDLLRYYSDDGTSGPSSQLRPFLVKESAFTLTANANGSDSRGIVIDPSPRIVCKSQVPPVDPGAVPPRTQADVDTDVANCARMPARVFFANRTPASVVLGEVGESSNSGDGTYDADRLSIFGNIPLSVGPSRLYMAPIVDADGNYALRVFIVCFDSSTIFVYDPDAGVIENIIRVGAGPFAMAFDPFTFRDAALRLPVAVDSRYLDLPPEAQPFHAYRFAYVASFTNSFVQVIDLDNSRPDRKTFETVVYTLGNPTVPKGSQ